MIPLAWQQAPDDLHDVLAEMVRRIVEVARPDRIVLFGSAARGDAGPDSDLDVLVVKAGVSHRRRLAQEIYGRLVGIPRAIDVLVVTPDDIERLRDNVGTIIGSALSEGRDLYVA
jgi:predicted nucleotidyltransferase